MHFLGSLALALIPLVASPPNTVEVPGIGLQAPVVPAKRIELDNDMHTWTVPCGISASSITVGGNTSLFGHRDVCGGVFDDLPELASGDDVLYNGYRYVVSETQVVKPSEVWPIQDFGDERLTLISCWPPGSTAQRFVVVALKTPDVAAAHTIDSQMPRTAAGDDSAGSEASSPYRRCIVFV